MKIAGVWSGHDCSFYISENGRPLVHAEYERYIREKEPSGDSVKFMFEEHGGCEDIVHVATCHPHNKISNHKESYSRLSEIVKNNGGKVHVVGHHQAHAANAFFSSNFDEALILTLDGGGLDEVNGNLVTTACTLWSGTGNKIKHVHTYPINVVNIGGVWTRATRYIFKLQSGWPRGHQAGSVMAMAAVGDPSKYVDDFYRMLTRDVMMASHKPTGQPRGAYTGNDPVHPYLNRWVEIADKSEQDRFDLAAGLQAATEKHIREIIGNAIEALNLKNVNLCLAGGVSLNSVAVGKIKTWCPQIKDIYATPVPHDGGLPIGAAQYVWHQILDNPRIKWEDNFSPYLGYQYDDIKEALSSRSDEVAVEEALDDEVIDLLDKQNIVAVFGGGSESGRRALGNRSILVDPRSPKMKDIINQKVKHRQWYRPFAPSILREEVKNWFVEDQDSPYMSFVLKFKEEVKNRVPAVLHFDGTARLQTVTENDNKWYYNFIKKWHAVSGVPIILNTSFNDREPICETAEHALNCFLKTDIDYLYFYDENLLVRKIK
jgi:carbamoyltransferase